MPRYCTSSDVSAIYEDYDSLTGTNGTTLMDVASDWVTATLMDFYGSVFYESGTTYPFWIRRASALEAVYLGFKRRHEQAQTTSTGFWDKYHNEAIQILKDLQEGKHTLTTQDAAPWERGITPAVGVTNGDVTAPGYGGCYSNAEVPDQWFTGDYPISLVIEIDGAGSRISQQTFKWMYKYGSAWEDEEVALSRSWTYLTDGVYCRFVDAYSFAVGQQWEIACSPSQGRVSNKGDGIRSYQGIRI